MKRRSVSVFWGIMFLLGGFVGLVQYGVLVGFICFAIGVLLIIPFKTKSDPQEEAASAAEGKPQHDISVNPVSDRDTKSISFPVAGVTFSNESGKVRSRQTILRRILFRDPPFDCEHVVALEKYSYEGDPAYYVKVNDCIIGNVPKEFVPHVDANADRPYKIDDFQVYGGQGGKKFGASLKIVFLDIEQN